MSDQALPILHLDRRTPRAAGEMRLYGSAAEQFLARRRAGDGPRLIVTPNLDHWRLLSKSAAFRRAYGAAAIVLNDSRFLTRTLFGTTATTLPGSELAPLMLDRLPAGAKVMVIGAPPAVRVHLAATRPTLVFDAVEPSQGFVFRRTERRALAARARAFAPACVLVCTGAPQSEVLAHQLVRALACDCDILCCGAGLQFAAGLKARAPGWMRAGGVEWAWRLLREPHTRARYLLDALFLAAHARRLSALRHGRPAALARYRVTTPVGPGR